MAGTVVTTESAHTSLKKVVFAWTSSAGGAADAITVEIYDGQIVGLTTIPAAAGDAPDDNYDVTLKDSEGHDVLLAAGVDRDTANTEHVTSASLAGVAGSRLTLAVTNAGNAKKGTVIVWVR